jgi:hypothetical protein
LSDLFDGDFDLVLGEGSFLMAAPKKYPDDLMDRGVRLVFESRRPITPVRAIWSQARRKEIDMVDPITAVVAVALITLLRDGKKK